MKTHRNWREAITWPLPTGVGLYPQHRDWITSKTVSFHINKLGSIDPGSAFFFDEAIATPNECLD